MKSVNAWCEKIAAQGGRMFFPANRYVIDFADSFFSEGWQQYDTDQDAEYFGCWINKLTLSVLSYTEGDWFFRQFDSRDEFNAEIEQWNQFYGEGFICKSIDVDAGEMTTFVQDRSGFLIGEES